jgi:hypothetical protein
LGRISPLSDYCDKCEQRCLEISDNYFLDEQEMEKEEMMTFGRNIIATDVSLKEQMGFLQGLQANEC